MKQTIDTWSFGCVLSAAATWIVLGFQGIEQFRVLRELAAREYGGTVTDRFHDGDSVLPDIKHWHSYLTQHARPDDTITPLVLELIESGMLLKDPDCRLSSSDLCEKWEQVLRHAEADRSSKTRGKKETHDSVKRALLTVEKAAPLPGKVSQAKSNPQRKVVELQDVTDGNVSNQNNRRILFNPSIRASNRIGKDKKMNIPFAKTPYREKILEEELKNRVLVSAVLGKEEKEEEEKEEEKVDPGYKTPPVVSLPEHVFELPWEICQVRRDIEAKTPQGLGARFKGIFKKEPEDEHLGAFIHKRDLVLVIDNGTSMQKFWPIVTFVAITLAMKIAGLDEDRYDVRFTINGAKYDKFELKGKSGLKTLKKTLMAAQPQSSKPTDMSKVLDDLFREHRRDHYRKATTLLVLTDGAWEGTIPMDNADNKIVEFARDLGKVKAPDPHYTIGFIRFGVEFRDRLKALDDELSKKHKIR